MDEEDGYINLTEEGERIARSTYERHKVLSSVLIHIGVSEETAMEDACAMEHIISEETFEKLKKVYMRDIKKD